MSLTVRTRHFRGLADIDWTIPPGLSVLVGGNGAGKTTFLFIVDILRRATARDGSLASALDDYGGGRGLKYFGAPEDAPVIIGAELDGISWSIEPMPVAGGLAAFPAESLKTPQGMVFERTSGSPTFEWKGKSVKSGEPTIIRRLADAQLDEGAFPGQRLLDLLANCRIYYDYDLARARGGSQDTPRKWLYRTGENVFSVLRNWRDSFADRERYDFVEESLRECFGFFEALGFEKSGNVIEGLIKHRTFKHEFPAGHAANGWFVALMHFTAIAGADRGQVICIDEFENAMHPRAVSTALKLLHEYVEATGISVVLTSQSPQVLDWFDAHPDRVFVLDRRYLPGPLPITELRTRQWLSHFRLGDKYADGDFGAEP